MCITRLLEHWPRLYHSALCDPNYTHFCHTFGVTLGYSVLLQADEAGSTPSLRMYGRLCMFDSDKGSE